MSPSKSSQPRKRQYQPSIAAYFKSSTDHISHEAPNLAASRLLPADTQASLLSVGMRVRESFPEGYKTHKTMPVTGALPPSSAPELGQSHIMDTFRQTKELVPLCGLFKTGGYRQQPTEWAPCSSAPPIMQRNNDHYVPDLTLSQSTLQSMEDAWSSQVAQPTSTRKRTYDEEMEEEMDIFFDDFDAEESVAPQRPIAVPKGYRRQQNDDSSVIAVVKGDFDEAAFLVPPGRMELEPPNM